MANGGWGAIAVYLYSYAVIHFQNLTTPRAGMVIAAAPALLLMFLVYRFNHKLNDFWAGGKLKESTETIQRITGENDSYHSASQAVQTTVDEFDEKAFGHHVGILSGLTLAVLLPSSAFLTFGYVGLFSGLFGAVLAVWGLSVQSFRELNRLASNLSVPYEENYENQ
ncbi:hypothetical protein [Halostella pelagica]|uniref:hypothetical protein n=1 Tax=Halostella pelagica TaxID=2583824 RepID=UPI001080AB54|nr:hypothetical protein [Halostella pelagica]